MLVETLAVCCGKLELPDRLYDAIGGALFSFVPCKLHGKLAGIE